MDTYILYHTQQKNKALYFKTVKCFRFQLLPSGYDPGKRSPSYLIQSSCAQPCFGPIPDDIFTYKNP